MNFPKRKLLQNCFAIAMLFVCCQNRNSNNSSQRVVEISSAVLIDEDYKYSTESIREINGNKVWLRYKACYGTNGNINKLIVYKPEGVLQYEYAEIMADTNIVLNFKLPLTQMWVYRNNKIDKHNDEEINVELVNDTLLMSKVNHDVIFYRTE